MSLDRWPPAVKESFTITDRDPRAPGADDLVTCPVCKGSMVHPNRDPSPGTILWLLNHARACRAPQRELPGLK